MCGVPETLLLWPLVGGETELDSIRWKEGGQEEEEEREPEETRHGECEERPIVMCFVTVCHSRVNLAANSRLFGNLVLHSMVTDRILLTWRQ